MKKNILCSAILDEVLARGEATRPELVNITGVRAASVFEAVDALKREGILYEPERNGRRVHLYL